MLFFLGIKEFEVCFCKSSEVCENVDLEQQSFSTNFRLKYYYFLMYTENKWCNILSFLTEY